MEVVTQPSATDFVLLVLFLGLAAAGATLLLRGDVRNWFDRR